MARSCLQKGLGWQKRRLLLFLFAWFVTGAATVFLVTAMAKAASGPPDIPHQVKGREDCLQCHAAGLMKPVPQSHLAFAQKVPCLSCHKESTTAEAVSSPPEISHQVEGREDCLQCHAAGLMKPVPQSHLAFAQEVPCLSCHRVSTTLKAASSPPEIPHQVEGREDCLKCHGTGLIRPVPQSHLGFTEKGICLRCHAVSTLVKEEPCLLCHRQRGLNLTLKSGETVSLFVDSLEFASTVHGNKLQCSDCHTNISGYPHPPRQIATRRDYSIATYEMCKRCHFANYTKTLDSIHFETLQKGIMNSPVCTDCHGAHDVLPPGQPKAQVSRTCSGCHTQIYADYVGSAHGKALLQEDNRDVPVCTECHSVHDIQDPRTVDFRFKSVELCARCHTNKEMMQRYGISTSVVKTYLEDFHGRTMALKREEDGTSELKEPVCIDCHGVHDITRVEDPQSSVFRANLVTTCRKCHSNATENFPATWLSHYEPSPDKAPLVFYTRLLYWILIPFIILGLMVHIFLDLWRVITNR